MYQAIVLGLGFLLVFGGGYLINQTDKGGVIESAVAEDPNVYLRATSTIPGVYFCNSDCPDERELTLLENGDAELTTVYNGGVETLKETGTWKLLKDKVIVLSFSGNSQSTYDQPLTFSLRRVTERTFVLSGDVKATYKDFGNPAFRKEENSVQE